MPRKLFCLESKRGGYLLSEPFRRRPVLPVGVPTRLPAVRHPVLNRPWYVRVLDSKSLSIPSEQYFPDYFNSPEVWIFRMIFCLQYRPEGRPSTRQTGVDRLACIEKRRVAANKSFNYALVRRFWPPRCAPFSSVAPVIRVLESCSHLLCHVSCVIYHI